VLSLILITCSKKRDIVQLPNLLPGQTIGPSGTRDKGKKSGTVPEIPGQLEPMEVFDMYQFQCLYTMQDNTGAACYVGVCLIKSDA